MLFSEPKIPQCLRGIEGAGDVAVSVLFSEPKIPQLRGTQRPSEERKGFSALQRAENSSIDGKTYYVYQTSEFQCSSASRKFLNLRRRWRRGKRVARFSALQRAENSSMLPALIDKIAGFGFSALQRAENSSIRMWGWKRTPARRFSALQRAENSSI